MTRDRDVVIGESVVWIDDAQTQARPSTEVFTIGDLAREFDVTLRALRFYEDKGLLAPRREGLTRLYSRRDRERLAVILKGKRFGFTLTEIKAMVAQHEAGSDTPDTLRLSREKALQQITALEKQKQEIEQAIAELKSGVLGVAVPGPTA